MQAFSLNHASGIPVKLQLKAHVKYQIMAAILRPGDQLPPLRDLAAGLGINLNTVVRALHELEDEGFVYSHQGKGVFITDEFPGQGHGAALRSLLAGVIGPAREWGMSPEEIGLALMAHGQLAKPPQAAPYRMLLVGGSRFQLRRLQGELEGALPVVVETALAEEVAEKIRAADFRAVASTLFHAADVRAHLPKGIVITLATASAEQTLQSVAHLPGGSIVAVASRDWVHAARVRRSLEVLDLGHVHFEVLAGQTPASLAPVLTAASFIIATADCREIAREALAGRTDIPLLAEPMELPADAIASLRRGLGAPPVEQRISIRSAWV
jgi:DNA-binding transcriptional regulator YhcF (GntR family)